MKQKEREAIIQELIAKEDLLSVSFLAKKFNVSEMTIRRDLARMEKKGLIIRRYGGCIRSNPFTFESTFLEKEKQHRKEKEAIAKAILPYIKENTTLYIDTGSTATILARLLPENLHIKVFTPNLAAAMELFKKKDIKVFVLGGMLAEKSPDLIGETTLNAMRSYRFNIAIIGSDALEIETGIFYSADIPTAILSATALELSEKAFLAIDSSKIDKRSVAKISTLSQKICIATDDNIHQTKIRKIKKFGAEILIAKIR